MPSDSYKYIVMLPKGLRLEVEMHNRPVDFEIIFPGDADRPVFSRVQSTDKTVKGTVKPVGALLPKPDVERGGKKYKRMQRDGHSDMAVEYSDPEMP